MKQRILCMFTAWMVTCSYAQHNAEQKVPAVTKTPIALLGTYHFDNPDQDQFNIKSDSIFSSKRQKELEALVKQLAKFSPTHIALEFNASDSALDIKYQQYRRGNYTLGASEREQIGFRLAKMLGHPHIYAVDAPDIQLEFEPGPLANEFQQLLEELGQTGNAAVGEINEWIKQYSIGQVLGKMNSFEFDKLNIGLYYNYLLPVGKGDTQPGLEAVTRWYKRNLFILHHIMKLTQSKSGNRVLVIFGQGHTAMLKQFLQYSNAFELADIQQFLPKK